MARFAPREKKDHRGVNLTEAAYERDVLKPLLVGGAIVGYRFQPVSLKYAERPSDRIQACTYKPDWQVTLPSGQWAFVEIKRAGKGQQSQKTRARVAIRACAACYQEFHFTWAEGSLRKRTSSWKHEVIGGAEWWSPASNG